MKKSGECLPAEARPAAPIGRENEGERMQALPAGASGLSVANDVLSSNLGARLPSASASPVLVYDAAALHARFPAISSLRDNADSLVENKKAAPKRGKDARGASWGKFMLSLAAIGHACDRRSEAGK